MVGCGVWLVVGGWVVGGWVVACDLVFEVSALVSGVWRLGGCGGCCLGFADLVSLGLCFWV